MQVNFALWQWLLHLSNLLPFLSEMISNDHKLDWCTQWVCSWDIFKAGNCPVGWDCRLHRLHLCWGVRHHKECPGYNTKQSDCEAPVMQALWGMKGTSSLPWLPGPFLPRVVAPDRIQSSSQIELKCVLMLNWFTWNRTALIFKLCTYAKLNCLKWNCYWHGNCSYDKLNCLK